MIKKRKKSFYNNLVQRHALNQKKIIWFFECYPLKEKNQAKFFLVLFCIYDFSETTKFIMGFLKGF